jgi:hypothetical protein
MTEISLGLYNAAKGVQTLLFSFRIPQDSPARLDRSDQVTSSESQMLERVRGNKTTRLDL